jgi:hypothetical protein
MNLPEDILKQVNEKNWEELWDEIMTTYKVEGDKHDIEYVWDTETTKQFIENLVKSALKSAYKEGLTKAYKNIYIKIQEMKDKQYEKHNILDLIENDLWSEQREKN